MKTQCVMCGRDIAQGILCEKCDRPKRSSSKPAAKATPAPPVEAAPREERSRDAHVAARQPEEAPQPEPAPDPFPKAPVLPFPVEATSLAVTSMYEVLSTAGIPSVLIAADRSVRFVSDSARTLLKLTPGEPLTTKTIESRLNFHLPMAQESLATTVQFEGQQLRISVIPLSGGASGAVVILKGEEGDAADSATISFIRETVITPLMALHAALTVAVSKGRQDPLLQDAVATLDQILSSLELSPRNDLVPHRHHAAPTITSVLQTVMHKAGGPAANKNVKLQLDAPESDETFGDSVRLEKSLFTLVENALHYVPAGGQVVLGLRFLEHKGKPLLLFFVMDNGPIVAEEMRTRIFDADFDPASAQGRSGKNLTVCREFALAHGGQVWVESKTGKACTFFLRVSPDVA